MDDCEWLGASHQKPTGMRTTTPFRPPCRFVRCLVFQAPTAIPLIQLTVLLAHPHILSTPLKFQARVLRSRIAVRKISLNSVLCGRRLQGFGAPGYMATTVALQVGLCPTSNFSASQIRSHVSSGSKAPAVFPALKCKERARLLRWKETRVSPVVVGAASPSFDAFDSGPSTSEREGEEFTVEMSPQSWEEQRGDPQAGGLVLSSSSTSLQTLSKDVALGIVLQAAGSSNGWTTGSGLEGPSYSMEMAGSEMPGPIFSKSPRRRMRVAFTCNVCGHRTTRAINPHAYTDGTVFVQCGGCDIFHKLVDNLKLFHELKGRVYRGYECFEVGFDQPYDFLG